VAVAAFKLLDTPDVATVIIPACVTIEFVCEPDVVAEDAVDVLFNCDFPF
jgi:hypothetical protein